MSVPGYEKLGVDIHVTLNKEFQAQIASLQTMLNGLKVDKIIERVSKVESSLAKMGAGAGKGTTIAKTHMQAMAGVFKITEEQVVKLNNAFAKTAAIEKFGKGLQKTKILTTETQRAMAAMTAEAIRLGAASKWSPAISQGVADSQAAKAAAALKQEQAARTAMNAQRVKEIAANLAAIDRQRQAALKAISDEQAARRVLTSQRSREIASNIAALDRQRQAALKAIRDEQSSRASLQSQRERDIARNIAALDQQRQAALRAISKESTTRATSGVQAQSGQLREAGQHATLLNVRLQTMAQRLAEFYTIRAIYFAITSQVREAVRGLIDLSQTLQETAAISSASAAQLELFRATAYEVGRTSKFTAAEVAETMRVIAQTGVMAKDLPYVTKVVEQFATGTGSGAVNATKAFTTAMNVWKIEAKDSSRIANNLTAALNTSKLTVGDLSTAFNYLASQGAAFGMEMEEVTAIIGVMANTGIKASTIGTGVSGLLARLAAPTARMARLFEHYKISIDEVNPTMHKFSDIVKVFTDRGVSAVDILDSMDKRVGRSLVAAMTAGSAAFESMERGITGTNAAFNAYTRAMDGAIARINVFKSELLVTVGTLVNQLQPAIDKIYDGVVNFTRGMRTAEGATIALTTAVTALSAAIFLLGWKNPIMAGISLAFIGIGYAISKFGENLDRSSEHMRSFLKEWAKVDTELQRGSYAFHSLSGELEKYADNDDAIQITDDMREKLRELVEYSPMVEDILEKQTTSYREMALAMESVNNGLRTKINLNTQEAASQYNSALVAKKVLEQDMDRTRFNIMAQGDLKDKAEAAMRGSSGGPDEDPWAFSVNTKNQLNAQAELGRQQAIYDRQLKEWKDIEAALKLPKEIIDGKVLYDEGGFAQVITQDMMEMNNNPPLVRPDPQRKTVDHSLANPLGDVPTFDLEEFRQTQVQSQLAVNNVLEKLDKEQMEITRRGIDNATTQAERKGLIDQARLQIEADVARINTDMRSSFFQALEKQLPNRLTKEELDYIISLRDEKSDNGDFLRSPMKRAEYEQRIDVSGKEWQVFNDASATVNPAFKELAALTRQNALEQFDASVSKETKFRPDSTGKNKGEDMAVISATKALELQKEQAWTAQEIEGIERKILERQIQGLQYKERTIAVDIQGLYTKQAIEGLGQQDLQTLESLESQHAAITEELEQQNALLERRQSEGMFDSFAKGMRKSNQETTNLTARTEELGSSIHSTFTNGFGDAISNMITGLAEGENAWKNFRQGLGGILKSIADMLQDYIAKMIAVWVVQQIVGLAVGSASSGATTAPNGAHVSTSGGQTTAFGMKTGGYITAMGNVQRYNEGGAVPTDAGFAPNVDSVPALLMPGEFVLNKSATEYYGTDTLFKMNAKKFADGGPVGSAARSNSKDKKDDDEKGDVVLNIINVVDPRTIPKTSAAEILNVISLDAQNNGPTTKTIRARMNGTY